MTQPKQSTKPKSKIIPGLDAAFVDGTWVNRGTAAYKEAMQLESSAATLK